MAAPKKQVQQLARQFFAMSLVDGRLSEERVAGVLSYLEKNPPAQPIEVLKAYQRLVAIEVAKNEAVVEHAGPIGADVLSSIESSMSQRYQRTVTAKSKPNPALLAGLRVRVGDDIYESSVANQLAGLTL
ncbi:MAG TPA: F0F1 ATP synthase subunit delta [Opitutaceae bacterium]|nr:F0F1 ATP synthase subunit delta [Opitutaceae bacterium]